MENFIWSLIAFVLVLSPIVFIHELGHYLVAKAFGVHAESFSIGFGPQLLGWTDKAGTRWKICLFLLGGYVQMAGDSQPSEAKFPRELDYSSRTLESKTPFQRILIALSGPLANYLLAFTIFMALFLYVGLPKHTSVIGHVAPQSVASQAGLQKGDRIVEAKGQAIESFESLIEVLQETPRSLPLPLSIQRGDTSFSVILPPSEKNSSWQGQVGVGPSAEKVSYERLSLPRSLKKTLHTLNPWTSLKSLKVSNLGGPVLMAQQAGSVFKQGLISVVFFMAVVSAGLGFFNLLPLPVLDGGRVLLSFIEILLRRPLSERTQQIVSVFSLIFLGSFFIFLSWKDLRKIPSVLGFLKSLGIAK